MDNQEAFLEAFGAAYNAGVPGTVNAKELHYIVHDRESGVLEDTLLLGDVAVVNRAEIGRAREIVGPDGSTMTVTARWDGDVWVEVDDALVLETRRWIEGDFLVVARTTTRADGRLVTSRAFMGKPRRKAPTFDAAPPAAIDPAAEKRAKKKAKKAKTKRAAALLEDEDAKSDAGSEAESVYSHVEKAVETVASGFGLGTLFGGSAAKETESKTPKSADETSALSARGAAKPADAAAFFGQPRSIPFCGSFPCTLRGARGHLYIFEFHVGFAALNLSHVAKWSAPAKLVNNLEIGAGSSLLVGLTTGLNLELDGVGDRDAAYECMVNMLEKIPPSPGEEVYGEPDARIAAPLRVGFEPERYVFVHVVQAGSLPEAAAGSVAIATAALGRYGAAVTSKGPTIQGAPTRFGRTLAFPAAEADIASDCVVVAVAGGGLGEDGYGASTLGEAQLPLATLPRDRAGAEEVKENPFTVRLMPPGKLGEAYEGVETPDATASGKDRSYRRDAARARRVTLGDVSVVAWVGTTSDLYELGAAATLAEPSSDDVSIPAALRVPPAVSRVTINVHRVRGVVAKGGLGTVDEDAELDGDDGEPVDLRCRLKIGDQMATTTPAPHTPKEQATWGPSTRQFIAMEPRGGAMTVDLLAPGDVCVGRVDVDISSLPMRPAKGAFARAHWLKLRRPTPEEDASSYAGSRRSSRSGSGRSRASRMTKPVEPTGATFFGFRFGGPVVQAASTVVEEEESEEESVDESEDESEYESTMNGDAGEEEEYIGEILLDGFVDEGCGAAARIGKKRPLGELSIEILSMRGITPDGKTERAVPSVMFKMGGSWAHLPASARGAPPAWRREIVAAVYDPSDAADIGVFDSADADAPLGFINVPVSRLPRDVPLVSTLALTGGATANPSAEITVRARYVSKTSPAAFLLSYFAPPLPRSAYLFANAAGDGKGSGVEELVAQQREYAEDSLLEGPAPLPATMVGAMLPRGAKMKKKDALGSARGVKACVVRVAAALDPFAGEIRAIRRALSWESPLAAGALHVALIAAACHPGLIFPAVALWSAARASMNRKRGRWTLLGADKSDASGSFDIGRAPPGSKLVGSEAAAVLGPDAPSELAGADPSRSGKTNAAGVSAASRALGVNPSVEMYEECVQMTYWAQALARHLVPGFETLHDLASWKDVARSNAFMLACFGGAFFFLFVKVEAVLLVAAFVALRHPILGKPATLPYRLALAAES